MSARHPVRFYSVALKLDGAHPPHFSVCPEVGYSDLICILAILIPNLEPSHGNRSHAILDILFPFKLSLRFSL